ncbi:MAG: hypothetical protein PHT55_08945, partial [Spirochaetales bacterium]|nr:hypothetical protein [Spirochaetales bacterium]
MKLRALFLVPFLIFSLAIFSCDLAGGSDDLDIPSSGAENAPASADDAKALYLAASDAVFEEVNPLADDDSKELRPKILMTFDLGTQSANGITMKGTLTVDTTPDQDPTDYTFTDETDLTLNMEGTMDKFTVTDLNDSSKSYTVSGTIVNYMSMKQDLS